MTNQDHIDRIVKYIMTRRKITPEKIEAYSKVIEALSKVKEPAVKEANSVKDAQEDNLVDNPDFNLAEITNIEIGGTKRKINIIPNSLN